MLQPARTKYRKQQKGRNTGVATRGAMVSFGEFGLKATTRGRLTARQLEARPRAPRPRATPRGGARPKPPQQSGGRQTRRRDNEEKAGVVEARRSAHGQ